MGGVSVRRKRIFASTVLGIGIVVRGSLAIHEILSYLKRARDFAIGLVQVARGPEGAAFVAQGYKVAVVRETGELSGKASAYCLSRYALGLGGKGIFIGSVFFIFVYVYNFIALNQLEVKIVSTRATVQNAPEVMARFTAQGAVVSAQGKSFITLAPRNGAVREGTGGIGWGKMGSREDVFIVVPQLRGFRFRDEYLHDILRSG